MRTNPVENTKREENKNGMPAEDSVLSEAGILKHLPASCSDFRFHIYDTVTSTNTVLTEMARAGAKEGTVVAARSQTNGRGRKGHTFYAPKDAGLYFSVLIRPEMPAKEALLLTACAAAAAASGIEKASGRETQIKWVNDIIMGEKKVCGILTESAINPESKFLDYAVIGVGINLFPPPEGFPKEIESSAGTVFDDEKQAGGCVNRLLCSFLGCFTEYYRDWTDKAFIEEYRKRSYLTGKKILITGRENDSPVTAVGIDDACRLIVRDRSGNIQTLSSGEVSVRPAVSDI